MRSRERMPTVARVRRTASTLAALAMLAAAAPAHADELLDDRVAVDKPLDADCTDAPRTDGAGFAQRTVAPREDGYLTARLNADGGEWDLAVFDPSDPEPVAASVYPGADEVAAGHVGGGRELIVQACRRSGDTAGATLTVDLSPGPVEAPAGPISVVRVSTPTAERKGDLLALDLDVTENGGDGYVDVVLYGPDDEDSLRSAGFSWKLVDDPDPAAPGANALPSGRTRYRRLFEIHQELIDLAGLNPDIVKLIQLPHQSGEGRRILGLEITTTPHARDGKPVFLMLGMHHAREWPAAELPMEWAHELIDGFRNGDPRTVDLVGRVRTIIVPVTNADGYNDSRESGHLHGNDDGSGDQFAGTQYRRKNCRLPDGTHHCLPKQNNGILGLTHGVDPNRNYAGFWGGIGSGADPLDPTFKGAAPFSEPDTENIRKLISSRQVVALITNHTAGRKILRQPGVESLGPAIDEIEYKALGDAMAAENGYNNQFSKQLYDHGGTTDAWSYYSTGAFSYVFEANTGFHPPYAEVVEEYDGTASGAGGNREAYFLATEWAADPAGHSVLKGVGPPGAILRLTKSFATKTQEGPSVPDRLDSTMLIPSGGSFEWHVNPSTRPIAAESGKRENWRLTCERPEGTVLAEHLVFVRRGETVDLSPGPCPQTRPGEQLPIVPEPGQTYPGSGR
jgi:hypothetical protein